MCINTVMSEVFGKELSSGIKSDLEISPHYFITDRVMCKTP